MGKRLSVNKCLIGGYVGADPRLITSTTTDPPRSVLTFTLCTNESMPDGGGGWINKAVWHNIVLVTDAALRGHEQIKKGCGVLVEGKHAVRVVKASEPGAKDQYFHEFHCQWFQVVSEPSSQEDTLDQEPPPPRAATSPPRSGSRERAPAPAAPTPAAPQRPAPAPPPASPPRPAPPAPAPARVSTPPPRAVAPPSPSPRPVPQRSPADQRLYETPGSLDPSDYDFPDPARS